MNMQQRSLNGWRQLALMPLLLLAVLMLVLVGSLGFRGTAHAQIGNSNSITVASTGKIVLARTAVQISVTVTCTIPDDFSFVNGFGTVGITQVSGHQVTQGFGTFDLTTCDGTAQIFQVIVTPGPGSTPFHGGSASATGSLTVNYLDTSGFPVQEQTSTGPQIIRIKG